MWYELCAFLLPLLAEPTRWGQSCPLCDGANDLSIHRNEGFDPGDSNRLILQQVQVVVDPLFGHQRLVIAPLRNPALVEPKAGDFPERSTSFPRRAGDSQQ
jgi:hypothetical protein